MKLNKNNIILPKQYISDPEDDKVYEELATSFFKGLTFFVRAPFLLYKLIKKWKGK